LNIIEHTVDKNFNTVDKNKNINDIESISSSSDSENILESMNNYEENNKILMDKPESKVLTKKIVKVNSIEEGEIEKEIFVDDKGNEVDEE